jgi:hypothetical protein
VKYDLKKPCKNCPFGISETRITFACRERAEEIAESAYRNGFPCHLSAECIEGLDGEEGYVAGRDTQHCAGAMAMFLNDGHSEWPGIMNDDELAEQIAEQMGSAGLKMAFESEDAFLAANEGTRR